MKPEIELKNLRNTLSIVQRQEILNNGCAGMRSLLFYLDTIANKVDKLYGPKTESKPKKAV